MRNLLNMRKLNLLFVHNFYQSHGGEDHCYEEEIELLKNNGHKIIRYTRHNSEIKQLNSAKVAANAFWSQKTYVDIKLLIELHSIDLIHVHNFSPLISPSVFWCAKNCGIPVVHTVHNFRLTCVNGLLLRDGVVCESCLGSKLAVQGIYNKCYRDNYMASATVALSMGVHRLFETWSAKVDKFITPSLFLKKKIVNSGINSSKVVAKSNTISKHFGDVDLDIERSGGIFIGRLSQEKGLSWFLEFWKTNFSKVPLKIIGEGPLDASLRSLAIGTKITFMGQQDRNVCLQEIAKAKFLIMPSIWYETFGRTIVEAFSVGTPVLVSSGGAMEELVSEDYLGKVFVLGQMLSLVEAVKDMLNKPVLSEKIIAFYEAHFSDEKSYYDIINIYKELVK